MEGNASAVPVNPYRRIVATGVGAAALGAGFASVSRSAAETLTEMALCFLNELGRSSKVACELAGRTVPVANDIIFSLIEMGFPVSELRRYHRTVAEKRRITIPAPSTVPVPTPPAMLHVGASDGPTAYVKKKRLRSNIPDFYPDFPDPHTYIWTPTYKQPVTDYLTIRDKAANQKRDVEKALCRFIAKTGTTMNLYLESDENTIAVPVIAVEPSPQPYLRALLFKDQYFNEEVDDENVEFPVGGKSGRRRRRAAAAAAAATSASHSSSSSASASAGHRTSPNADASFPSENGGLDGVGDGEGDGDEDGVAPPSPNGANGTPTGSRERPGTAEPEVIDNPYLRSPSLPVKVTR